MRLLLVVGLLAPFAVGGPWAQNEPLFPECVERPCYAQLERTFGRRNWLRDFCHDFLTVAPVDLDRGEAADCHDLSSLANVLPACACITGQEQKPLDGSKEGMDESFDKCQDADGHMDGGEDTADDPDWCMTACAGLPCYRFLDVSAHSAEELEAFCEEPLRGSAALRRRLGETSLREHCMRDPTQEFDVDVLGPACACVRGTDTPPGPADEYPSVDDAVAR